MFDWEKRDNDVIENELNNTALAANHFLRAWYFGEGSRVKVNIFGSQVYIDSEDFEYLVIDLKVWIFALRAEESVITAYSYKIYSDTLIKIISKIDQAMVGKFTKKDLNNIIDSVKPKDPRKLN